MGSPFGSFQTRGGRAPVRQARDASYIPSPPNFGERGVGVPMAPPNLRGSIFPSTPTPQPICCGVSGLASPTHPQTPSTPPPQHQWLRGGYTPYTLMGGVLGATCPMRSGASCQPRHSPSRKIARGNPSWTPRGGMRPSETPGVGKKFTQWGRGSVVSWVGLHGVGSSKVRFVSVQFTCRVLQPNPRRWGGANPGGAQWHPTMGVPQGRRHRLGRARQPRRQPQKEPEGSWAGSPGRLAVWGPSV